MASLRDSDFPALGTDSPAEKLVSIRFRWYHQQANRARIAYRTLGVIQLFAALVIAISVAIQAPNWLAPALGGLIALAAQHAGRYASAENPDQLLTERVVEISKAETTDWETALKARSV